MHEGCDTETGRERSVRSLPLTGAMILREDLFSILMHIYIIYE